MATATTTTSARTLTSTLRLTSALSRLGANSFRISPSLPPPRRSLGSQRFLEACEDFLALGPLDEVDEREDRRLRLRRVVDEIQRPANLVLAGVQVVA